MRILLDHNVPRRAATLLSGHEVKTTRQMGWEQLGNGELLRRAAEQFEVFVSTDKKLRYQQNLAALPVAIVILDVLSNAFASIEPLAPQLCSLLNQPVERIMYIVQRDGQTVLLRL